jgi:DNA modification methylase
MRKNKNYFTWFESQHEGSEIDKKLDKFQISMPNEVSKKLIKLFSKKGDLVFDPFCGYGNILINAKKLGRNVFGMDINKNVVDYCIKRNLNVINENSLSIGQIKLPKFNACITSPPFFQLNTNDLHLGGDLSLVKSYPDYLNKLSKIFIDLRKNLNKDKYLIIIVKNLSINKSFIPLAWDLIFNLRKKYTLCKELIWVKSEKYYKKVNYRSNINHTYILVFKNNLE